MSEGTGPAVDPMLESILTRYAAYSGQADADKISRAYDYALQAHGQQRRVTGEPYIIHPLAVAAILTELEVDSDTLAAALLHDTVEDTSKTIEDIQAAFGDDVAALVDGVTKLSRIPYSSKEEIQAENFRKMFLAMARDIRVVLIKLADRLHNMRTMRHMSPDKQQEKARKRWISMRRWPIASAFTRSNGNWRISACAISTATLITSWSDRFRKNVRSGKSIWKRSWSSCRPRSGIWVFARKLKAGPSISTVFTGKCMNRTRIWTRYTIYLPPGSLSTQLPTAMRFWAWSTSCISRCRAGSRITSPCPSRTCTSRCIRRSSGRAAFRSRVQIRTVAMHRTAEYGIAAHWRYKENTPASSRNEHDDSKLTWLRQLLEWQKDMRDAGEFMESLKSGLIADEVFVFTPKGDVRSLPFGSVPADFAYNIHSGIGNRMYGAKVNGRIVPLTYELKNGDIVEILTSEKVHGPSRDWLKIVKSASARTKISQWFKKEMREENVIRGKEIMEREIKKPVSSPLSC